MTDEVRVIDGHKVTIAEHDGHYHVIVRGGLLHTCYTKAPPIECIAQTSTRGRSHEISDDLLRRLVVDHRRLYLGTARVN